MTDHSETAWEQDEIESHLRSAMDALTPNVFDKIDLSTPQEIYVKPSRRVRMYRRMRTVAMAAAACLCVAVLGGGVSFYQNHRVDSVIGIDVNPSIELSVNRNEKVLQANPLNEDAETILDDMNLKNLKRSTVQEVYDFIIKELEESCPDLVESTNHPLRIYQCAGWFFLGRAYWVKGDYENARIALEKALKSSEINTTGITLWDYNQMLSEWGYNSAKPYAWTSGFPANNTGANKEVVYNYQYSISSISSATGQPKLFIKEKYMDLYGQDDLRRNFFSNKTRTGAAMEGYRRLPCRTVFNLGVEMPDLYLMLVECQARSMDQALQNEARINLEEFRRHRMSQEAAVIPADITSQEKLIRFVVEERLREYMMTGIRWFDMRRLWNDPLFQDWKAEYTHTDGESTYALTEDRLVYQIPPKIVVFNNDWQNNK